MPRNRLSQKKVRMWQKRLRHSWDAYLEKGLIGSDRISIPRLLTEFYRGDHWGYRGNTWADLDQDELRVVNKIHEQQNTVLAQTSARDPKIQFFPAQDDRAAVQSVPRVQVAVNANMRRGRFRRQWNAALRDHCAFPVGIVRHGFTPEEEFFVEKGRGANRRQVRMEKFRPAEPNRPWIKRERMSNVLLPLGVEMWDQELPWVAFRDLMTLEEIDDNENMMHPDGLQPNFGVKERHRKMRPEDLKDDINPDLQNLVEVWTVYEASERTWFQIVKDGVDKPLRDQDDWPLPWGQLPVNLLMVNEQNDTPMPLSILEEMIPVQIERNELRTLMSALVKRMRRIIFFDENAIEEDDQDALINSESLAEFIPVGGNPNQVTGQISAGGFPAELGLYEDRLEVDGRQIIGVGRFDLAQRENVDTAFEAGQIAQGGDVQEGRRETAFREFLEDTMRVHLRAMREVMGALGEQTFPIRGEVPREFQGAASIEVSQADFDRISDDVEIEVGSTAPRDRDREAAEAAAMYQLAQGNPEIFRVEFWAQRLVELQNVNPAQGLTDVAAQAARIAANARMAENLTPPELAGRRANGGGSGASSTPAASRFPAAAAVLTGGGGGGR